MSRFQLICTNFIVHANNLAVVLPSKVVGLGLEHSVLEHIPGESILIFISGSYKITKSEFIQTGLNETAALIELLS